MGVEGGGRIENNPPHESSRKPNPGCRFPPERGSPAGKDYSVQLFIPSGSIWPMRALRILVAGLVAVAAMVAVMFAAAVVFLTGLAGYVAQLFGAARDPIPTSQARAPKRRTAMRTDDAIDVITTTVPDEPTKH